MPWNPELLHRIDAADDLKIAPYHPDGQTTGTPTWIWEVALDGGLFVRAYSGVRSRWHQAALAQQAGRVHAAGQVLEVGFAPVHDAALQERIDAAYRAKYARSPYLAPMVGATARAATVEILPA